MTSAEVVINCPDPIAAGKFQPFPSHPMAGCHAFGTATFLRRARAPWSVAGRLGWLTPGVVFFVGSRETMIATHLKKKTPQKPIAIKRISIVFVSILG